MHVRSSLAFLRVLGFAGCGTSLSLSLFLSLSLLLCRFCRGCASKSLFDPVGCASPALKLPSSPPESSLAPARFRLPRLADRLFVTGDAGADLNAQSPGW
jgi:hypothetical protein